MNKELTAEEVFNNVFSENMTKYDALDFKVEFNRLFKATMLAMEEFSNLKNQELKKEIEALKKFIQENHILLRKYKDCGSETFGGRMYFKSKTMLTNKQH